MKEIKKNTFQTCMPLRGKDLDEIEAEISAGMEQNIDFFEWRRDYFEVGEAFSIKNETIALQTIRNMIGDKGLIYTFRNSQEGAEFDWPDTYRLKAIRTVLRGGMVDYLDVELNNNEIFHQAIDEDLKMSSASKILSYHDFKKVPSEEELNKIFDEMINKKVDVLKIAVFPQSIDELRRLTKVALSYNDKIDNPMVIIGMGEQGRITRICPEICGGSITFIAGKENTAPGQLGIAQILELRNNMGF